MNPQGRLLCVDEAQNVLQGRNIFIFSSQRFIKIFTKHMTTQQAFRGIRLCVLQNPLKAVGPNFLLMEICGQVFGGNKTVLLYLKIVWHNEALMLNIKGS